MEGWDGMGWDGMGRGSERRGQDRIGQDRPASEQSRASKQSGTRTEQSEVSDPTGHAMSLYLLMDVYSNAMRRIRSPATFWLRRHSRLCQEDGVHLCT